MRPGKDWPRPGGKPDRRRRNPHGAGPVAAALAAVAAVLAGPAAMAGAAPHLAVAARAGAAPRRAAAALGGLRSWGRNDAGQLGNGNTESRDHPVTVRLPKGTRVTSVAAGDGYALAATSTGSVFAWGANSNGQLGDGSVKPSLTPVRVSLPAGTRVTAVRAGAEFSLALTSTGQVLAWGNNSFGQLGNRSTSPSRLPVLVRLGAGVQAKAIAAGTAFAMALTTNGHVLAWGQGDVGSLGDGSTRDRHLPVRAKLPPGVTASSIAAGQQNGLAVTTSGAFAWGSNVFGQLGTGDMAHRSKPARVILPPGVRSAGKITALSAGLGQTLALTSRGLLLAWGRNDSGDLGDDSTVSSDVAVRVMLPAGTRLTSVSAGIDSSYALTSTGRVLAWGDGGFGNLGNGHTRSSLVPLPVSLAAGLRATGIGAGPDTWDGYALVIR